MNVQDELDSLDPESPDFEERIARVKQHLRAEQRRKDYEKVLAVVNAARTPEDSIVGPSDALWGDGALAEQIIRGEPVNRAAHFQTKALLTNPGDIARQLPDVVYVPPQAKRVRDLIGPVALEGNERSVSFVRETGYTVSADVVAEGAAKPESTLSLEAKTEAVKTVAHHIPVTRQALASRAGMQRYVERRLVDGLLIKLDERLINGAGGASDIAGYLSDPGVQSVTRAAGETRVDALVKAVVQVAKASDGTWVTGVVVNYDDYYAMAVEKGSDGHYLYPEFRGQKVSDISLPFLGVPAVISGKIPAGTALVGAFGVGSALYEVPEGTIRATESHADEFIKNIVRVMAEIEVAHVIELPALFAKVTF